MEYKIILCPNNECGQKLRIPLLRKLQVKCPKCSTTFKYPFDLPKKDCIAQPLIIDYFEESVLDGDGVCSDNECPCQPPTIIPRNSGYLYIDQRIVDFRRQYPRFHDAQQAMEKITRQQYNGLENLDSTLRCT